MRISLGSTISKEARAQALRKVNLNFERVHLFRTIVIMAGKKDDYEEVYLINAKIIWNIYSIQKVLPSIGNRGTTRL
jgi:predicted peptidase